MVHVFLSGRGHLLRRFAITYSTGDHNEETITKERHEPPIQDNQYP